MVGPVWIYRQSVGEVTGGEIAIGGQVSYQEGPSALMTIYVRDGDTLEIQLSEEQVNDLCAQLKDKGLSWLRAGSNAADAGGKPG